ncbi:TPA: DUF5397 family protein, partial [Escherichia coli O113:H4]|nr:DUF5397 family protein [Escherichia coli O113:H4]
MNTTQIPTGAVKTFGAFGPPYQVGEEIKELPDGDILVNIILIQTSEKEVYKLSKL